MRDPTREFFNRLDRRAAEVLPSSASGTVRVDLVSEKHVDHWFVTIDKGKVRVTREDREADCTIRTGKGTFDRLAEGSANVGALASRTELIVTGSLVQLGYLRRLLPGPPGARDPRTVARERRQ